VNKQLKTFTSGLIILALSSCTSVKIPDFANTDEFSEAAANAAGYPNPSAAPQAPVDIRPTADWDQAAAELLAKKESFSIPDDSNDKISNAQINREIRDLKSKVREYRKDDPKN